MSGHSVRYHLSICALVLGCMLVSCGSKNDAAEQADGNTPATTSTEAPATAEVGSTTATSGAEPCKLLTGEEANAILGMKVTQESTDDMTCTFKPGEGNLLFGGVIISVVDNTGVFDMMTEGGEVVPGMGEKALLNGSTLGIWKGGKGTVLNLVNPPTDMNVKDVLTQMAGKIAPRL